MPDVYEDDLPSVVPMNRDYDQGRIDGEYNPLPDCTPGVTTLPNGDDDDELVSGHVVLPWSSNALWTMIIPPELRVWRWDASLQTWWLVESGESYSVSVSGKEFNLKVEGLAPSGVPPYLTVSCQKTDAEGSPLGLPVTDRVLVEVVSIDLEVAEISELDEETQPAFVPLNDDYDENNTHGISGDPVTDNGRLHDQLVSVPPRIVADDDDLVCATLTIDGPNGQTGRYWIEVLNEPSWLEYPDWPGYNQYIRIWQYDGTEVPRDFVSALPITLDEELDILIEGLALSQCQLALKAHFIPDGEYAAAGVFPVVTDEAEAIPIKVDLQIWNGQSNGQGASVGESTEWTVGAFTVANLNDTDGDGRIDNQDPEVKAYSHNMIPGEGGQGMATIILDSVEGFTVGDMVLVENWTGYNVRTITSIDVQHKEIGLNAPLDRDLSGGRVTHCGMDEVDLMMLKIVKPQPDLGGDVVLSVNSGNVKFWTESTKKTEVALTNGKLSIPVDQIPAEGMILWVEAVDKSTAVRDIELQLEYKGVFDKVRATGIWVEQTDVKHDKDDQDWQDITTPPGPLSQYPLPLRYGLNPIIPPGVHVNVIGIQYTVFPAGIQNEPNVYFDVGRRKDRAYWVKNDGQWSLMPDTTHELFPAQADASNDDSREDDESAAPNANGHIYVRDTPLMANLLINDEIRYVGNFLEYVRVGIGNNFSDPSGNRVSGSRASTFYAWNSWISLIWDAQTQSYKRLTSPDDPETQENHIRPGTEFWTP